MTTLYRFSASTLSGREQSLSEYRGKLLLVVNTASKCGFTPQFAGLERLYSTHSADGLEVLGFPCDQFADQEFDDAAQIAEFCSLNYGVTFPMFAKVDVNGDGAHPLFAWLRAEAPGPLGDARAQAARMVTGSLSYTRLEQIGFLQRLAGDPAVTDGLRTLARDGLVQIEAGA